MDRVPPSQANSAWYWPLWSVIAAFGAYFCMYGFRKPFTSMEEIKANVLLAGYSLPVTYKVLLVISQTLGYMLSKFIGIKIISEMPPARRAIGILVLVGFAELALVGFGVVPQPWNACCLFLNGLPLGMVFGLVLGFLEGRRSTEALAAGLCTSFILADGVTKSVGSWLLDQQVPVVWMPALAGMLFAIPLLVFVWMLSRVPPPGQADVVARSERVTLSREQRWSLYGRYWFGLTAIVFVYLLISILRSLRADFATELWGGLLDKRAEPETFSRSEFWVALGVLVVNGGLVFVRDSRWAFFGSQAVCCLGLTLILVALSGWQTKSLGGFEFMVLVGLGLYLPYVAIHTTVFERFLAMTREKGNLGFLMYVADAIGYLGVVGVLLTKNLVHVEGTFISFFLSISWFAAVFSVVCLAASWTYFSWRCISSPLSMPVETPS